MITSSTGRSRPSVLVPCGMTQFKHHADLPCLFQAAMMPWHVSASAIDTAYVLTSIAFTTSSPSNTCRPPRRIIIRGQKSKQGRFHFKNTKSMQLIARVTHLAKDDVLAVEPRRLLRADEKLKRKSQTPSETLSKSRAGP